MPGNVDSVLTSWSWIVRASSRTGRTIARSALRTPTPSTEQKISKNSRSIGREEADQPRDQPAHHRAAFDVEDRVERDRLAELRLELPPCVLGDQDLDLEGIDQEGHRLVGDRLKDAANFREHCTDRPFQHS